MTWWWMGYGSKWWHDPLWGELSEIHSMMNIFNNFYAWGYAWIIILETLCQSYRLSPVEVYESFLCLPRSLYVPNKLLLFDYHDFLCAAMSRRSRDEKKAVSLPANIQPFYITYSRREKNWKSFPLYKRAIIFTNITAVQKKVLQIQHSSSHDKPIVLLFSYPHIVLLTCQRMELFSCAHAGWAARENFFALLASL